MERTREFVVQNIHGNATQPEWAMYLYKVERMMALGVKSGSPEETRISPFSARCLRLRPGGSLNVLRETHCETYRARYLP